MPGKHSRGKIRGEMKILLHHVLKKEHADAIIYLLIKNYDQQTLLLKHLQRRRKLKDFYR